MHRGFCHKAIFFGLPLQKQKSGGAYTLASYAAFSAVLRTLLRFTKRSQSNRRHSCWQTSLPTRIDLIITDLRSAKLTKTKRGQPQGLTNKDFDAGRQYTSPCRLQASLTRSAAGMRTFFLGFASETRSSRTQWHTKTKER